MIGNLYFILFYKMIYILIVIVTINTGFFLIISLFVSYSSAQLLAPLHHVLLITPLSWGPYVSHLSAAHTSTSTKQFCFLY